MRLPSPVHAKKLANLAKQHQTKALTHVAVAKVGGGQTTGQMAKLAAVNPNLAHAARKMASQLPAKYPSHEAYNDALSSAHKSMHMATAFHKASKGLVQPMGKAARMGQVSPKRLAKKPPPMTPVKRLAKKGMR